MSKCGSNGCAAPSMTLSEPKTADAPLTRALYRIENMDCPTEEALIRDKLSKLPGITGLEFNLIQRTLAVSHKLPSLAPVEQALSAIGMRALRADEAPAYQCTVLAIAQMDCPTEEGLIRSKLAETAGVAALDFNLVQRTLRVTHAPDALPRVLAALRSLGFDAEVRETAARANPPAPEPSPTRWWPLAVSGLTATLAEAVSWLDGGNRWVVMALALVAILTVGLSTYQKGWIALRNRNLNINALMSIAVTGAMLIGHWPEAAMVMVLFALAEVIEAK